MKDLRTARKFRRDLKRITKRGLDRDRLDEVIDLLLIGEPLEEAHFEVRLGPISPFAITLICPLPSGFNPKLTFIAKRTTRHLT